MTTTTLTIKGTTHTLSALTREVENLYTGRPLTGASLDRAVEIGEAIKHKLNELRPSLDMSEREAELAGGVSSSLTTLQGRIWVLIGKPYRPYS